MTTGPREGIARTGGTKRETDTPRPSMTPMPQRMHPVDMPGDGYDAEEIEEYVEDLQDEITRCKEIAERDGRDYAKLSQENTQLRTERDRLLEYLGRIRPLAKSIALISEADQDAKDMADSIWTISIAALTAREGSEDE